MDFSIEPKRVCPHVRMSFDTGSVFDFPSEHNHCCANKTPKQIQADHQERYCLCDRFVHCPVYRRNDLAEHPGKIAFTTNLNGISPEANLSVWDTLAAKVPDPYFYAMLFMISLIMVGVIVQFALA